MRRLTLFISVALAMLVFAIPATAGAKSHHSKRHHRARVADRNHNGIPDRWEKKFRVHSATADPDRDGVMNIGEFHNGTSPRDADSNDNGIPDGRDDANDDGIEDGQEQSGTITSFDSSTGRLTVSLVNGDSLTGTVNSTTKIECDETTQPTTTASTRHDGGETESGDDNSGPGSTDGNSGSTDETQHSAGDDDQGDDNDDQGDDDQGEDNEATCGTDSLTAGTVVKEAELRLTSAGAVFEEIELGGKAPA